MSTEIKPGQVWAWNADIDADESQFRITAVEGDRARYEYLSENDPHLAGGFFHTVDTLTEKAHLVSEPDATPAPLDPSKVKAGDMVRVLVVTIDSPVYEVSGEAYMLGHALAVGGHVLTGPGVTLTAHHPAPEPEPEWKPGTAGMATLNHLVSDNSSFGMRVMRVEWDGLNGFATETGRIVEDGSTTYSVSDFVPLVVIDPATVDVDALVGLAEGNAALKFAMRTETTRDVVVRVLGGLGIEAS